MNLIKLNATQSTNTYLKNLAKENALEDYTVVRTDRQTNGRGQRHSSWVSENGKNLTVSVLKKDLKLPMNDAFLLSMQVSLAIYKVLEKYKVPNIKIKWPNDIMSGSKKICGILIENTVSGATIKSSVIGIGLNVNQAGFADLPNAMSLSVILGYLLDRDKLLSSLVQEIKNMLAPASLMPVTSIFELYYRHLYKFQEVTEFEDVNGYCFNGKITGISRQGKLLVLVENTQIKTFGLKEIKFRF